MTIDEIAHKLKESRKPISHAEVPSECGVCGVYGIFIKASEDLKGFSKNPDGLIYIGCSSDLRKREFEQDFNSGETGRSSLRRSIGAIFKEEFGLTAIPRDSGSSEDKYKFLPEGEEKLTNWMTDNLEVGICPLGDYESIKKKLIPFLRPTLCLKWWKNPDREEIKALRKKCADEART